ncbi:hypothetical protein C8T65DRAFT_261740 [Cerioporus squamosus]|nr:hypothetical protein C8T65DRAFT_261740 [Cerioporus squamosus]
MHNAPSDVEMAVDDAHEAKRRPRGASNVSSPTSTPPPSPSPAHLSPPVDYDSRASSVDLVPPPVAIDAAASSSEAVPAAEGARGRKSKPSSSNVAAAPSGAKPKSTKPAVPRASSPSPPPPPARQPLQTIRLDIKLGGPEDYEVNITELAKATGQRPATPAPEPKPDTSDESDADDDGGPKVDKQEQPQGKRRRKSPPFGRRRSSHPHCPPKSCSSSRPAKASVAFYPHTRTFFRAGLRFDRGGQRVEFNRVGLFPRGCHCLMYDCIRSRHTRDSDSWQGRVSETLCFLFRHGAVSTRLVMCMSVGIALSLLLHFPLSLPLSCMRIKRRSESFGHTRT